MDPAADARPGSTAALRAFYELVPAADDLAHELRERVLGEAPLPLFGDDGLLVVAEGAEPVLDPVALAAEAEPVLTEGQLLGMLEHRLGARPVERDDLDGSAPEPS